MPYFARRDVYASKTASEITSEVYNVQGFDKLTVQIVGSPSTTTLQGSNDDGRSAAITNWSTISTVIGGNLLTLDPGFGWIRAQRSETTACIVAGWRDAG